MRDLLGGGRKFGSTKNEFAHGRFRTEQVVAFGAIAVVE